jgi:hypothetical protein
LQIIAGKEKPPLPILLRNLPVLVKVMFTASSRIPALMASVLENPQFGPEGHHAGHAEMILGLLYKAKKKRDLAVQHLNKASGYFPNSGRLQCSCSASGGRTVTHSRLTDGGFSPSIRAQHGRECPDAMPKKSIAGE